jgi:hypothetical protein
MKDGKGLLQKLPKRELVDEEIGHEENEAMNGRSIEDNDRNSEFHNRPNGVKRFATSVRRNAYNCTINFHLNRRLTKVFFPKMCKA